MSLPPILLRSRTQLVLVLLLALLLRLYGIEWGLPSATNPISSFHPDEAPTLLQGEWFNQGLFLPQQFVYGGSLYFSIVSAFLKLGDLLTPVLNQYNFEANALLAARYVMVYVALLTILLVYEAVREQFDHRKALLAAFILAITPSHVIMAQQMRPDEISGLLVALQYLLAVKVWHATSDNNARGLLWLAALIAGFMLAFRFPLVLFFAMPLVGWLLRTGHDFWSGILRRLFPATIPVCALLVMFGYAITSPATLSHLPIFVEGMKLQWKFQSSPFPDAVGMGPIAWQYWWGMLHQSLGYPFYLVTLAGIVVTLRRRSPSDWLLLVGLVPYMVMVSMTTWVVVRYTLPLVPLLVVVAADAVQWAMRKFPARAVQGGIIAASVLTLLALLAFLRVEAGINVRELTRQWVDTNVPHGRCVVVVKAYKAEEMYNPSLSSNRCHGTTELDQAGNDYTEIFAKEPIDYVLIHEHLYASMERLGAAHPEPIHADFYTSMLGAGFTLLHEVEVRPILFGMDFSSWFSSLDLTYVNPSYRVYQRTGTATPGR